MADSKVQIIINAKDNASGVLGKISGALGGLGKIAMTGLAVGAAAGVAGVVGLGAALYDCVAAASEAQDVQAQLQAVLRSTGGIAGVTTEMVNGLASSLQETTRFEDDVIIKAENMLLTFTNIGRNVFPLATDMTLDMAQALGMDATQAAMMLGKALNDPIAGVTALRRVGVQLSDDQENHIKRMMAMGDVEAAQAEILRELQREFGGSAEAAGTTFAGKLDILNNKLGDVKETIGGALLPVLSDLADKYVMPLAEKVQQVADRFAAWAPNIQVMVDALAQGNVQISTGIPILDTFANVAGKLMGAFQGWPEMLAEIFTGKVSPLDIAWGDYIPFTQISTGLQTVWLGIQAQLAQWGTDFWSWITTTVVPQASSKLGEVSAAINTWVNLPENQAMIQNVGATLGQGIVQGISDFLAKKDWGATVGQGAVAGIVKAGQSVQESIKQAGAAFANGIITGILDTIGVNLPPALAAGIRSAVAAALAAANPLGMVAGITGQIQQAITGMEALRPYTGPTGAAYPGARAGVAGGYQFGGVVPGRGPQLAVVHGGETITPAGGGAPQIIQLVVDGRVLAEVVSGLQGRGARQLSRMGGYARI